METRKLGSSGLEVSAMGLGCMGMTGPNDRPLTVTFVLNEPFYKKDSSKHHNVL